jgi:hypothetical protein
MHASADTLTTARATEPAPSLAAPIAAFCLGILAIYASFVVTVFFAAGLGSASTTAILGGAFDPKSMAFFQLGAIYVVAAVGHALAAPAALSLAITAAVKVLVDWSRRRTVARVWPALAVLGVAVLGFVLSPVGRLIGTWFAD